MHLNNSVTSCDTMRLKLFQNIYKQYEKSELKAIPNNAILSLKEALSKQNKKNIIRKTEIALCLKTYVSLYQILKNEENNIFFIDTVIPVLLDQCNFYPNESSYTGCDFLCHCQDPEHYRSNNKYFISASQPNDVIFEASKNNEYLMRTLIFQYKIPLKMSDNNTSWLVNQSQRDQDKRLNTISRKQEKYLKSILTPPDSWFKEIKKNTISSMFSFVMCLKILKKENSRIASSYSLPKILILDCILKELIKCSIPQEYYNVCTQIVKDIHSDLKRVKASDLYKKDFFDWAQITINPELLLYNSIVHKK